MIAIGEPNVTPSEKIDDLALALIAQNNMITALIRTHPNRDVLATVFDQAQRQFPEARQITSDSTGKFPYASSTFLLFEKALVTPLDP